MVAGIGQGQITSLAQYRQLEQAALASTVLNPDLQKLADIINDKSGQSSDADKVKAYLEEHAGYAALQGRATVAESAQDQRFRLEIQGSSIAAAISDGQSKVFEWQRASDGSDASKVQLWASLSEVQKQLPQFQIWKPTGASDAASIQYDPVTVSAAAESLFRGDGPTSLVPRLSGSEIDALYERDVENTSLAPGLQRLADIINDDAGRYSESDTIAAYTQAYQGLTALLTTQESGITPDQELQYEKFRRVIANSEIGEAAASGAAKLAAYESSHGGIAGNQRGEFYAGLSALEKQLPEFRDFGASLAVLFKANGVGDLRAYLQHKDAALVAAQTLFGTNSTAGDRGRSNASTASPLRVEVNA